MQFDNRQFEENVSTTMSSLGKLRQSLNLTGASKGLEDVGDAARNCNVSALGNAVETVKAKFSALQIMGVTALANITNSAVNAGKRIVSALTIDPIKMGFSEYETQINAVQTILANTESKGKTLNDVNAALDELNAYADKTIYNFTEMTRNIGTFTAAGVDLDTSVQAIKGIANLAAVSGSNSQQASTAMYQLSQAMASGTVKLMDWNSVVNAGMGGQIFQDALKETAKVHGVAIDDIIKKQGSFRESLSEGWLTTEILTDTLAKFTGDLSEEQLKSMGYTEKQIEEIMKLGQTANDAATKVKTFSQLFDTLKEAAQSGWTQTWEILVGDFEEAKELLTSVSDTIGEMINKSAEARNEMLENWKVLGGRDDLIESLKNTFEGLMSIIKPIKEAFREIFPPITAEQLAGFTEGLKNLTSKFKLSEETSENLKRTFKGLFAVVDIVKQIFVAVAKAVGSLFGTVGKLGGGILGVTASFGDWLVNINETIKSSDIFNKVLQGIVDVIKSIVKTGSKLAGFFKKTFVSPALELFSSLLQNINDRMSGVSGAAGKMKDGVVSAVDGMGAALEKCSLLKILKTVWDGILIIGSAITRIMGSLLGSLIDKIGNADFQGVLDFINGLIAGGIGLGIMKFINGLSEPLEGLSDIFEGFGDCLEGFQTKLKADALMKIAGAIAILVGSLVVLSVIDKNQLMGAIGAITTLFTELVTSMGIINKLDINKNGLIKISVAMTGLATALLILSLAMKIVSTMSWSELARGLVGITVGLTALVAAVKLMPVGKMGSAASAMKKMSTALLILSVAIKIMSTMSWEEMAVGLVTMVAGLAALVGAVHLLPKDTMVRAAGLISLATAMLILSAALKIMSTMSWEEVAISLTALAGSLAILAVGVNAMMTALPGAAAMLIVAPALVILASALKIMSTMSWGELAVSLVTLAGALGILAFGLTLMMASLPGAAALVVAAGALAILAPVLILLGSVSWQTVVQGLLTIAGAFTIIGVAGLLLGPVVPAILALAGAIALIGVGILAAGVGLTAFGAGLSALAVGFTAITASLGVIVTGLISIVSGVITGIIKGVGEGIIALCEVIIEGAPAICEALTAIIVSVCDAIVDATPSLIKTVEFLLTELLNFLIRFVPKLVDAGTKLIVGLLQGISRNVGKITSAAVDLIIAFINGIASQIPKVINAAVNLMVNFVNGLADGIRTNTPKVIDAVNNLMSSVAFAIGAAIGNIPEMGRQIVSGLVQGIKSSSGSFFSALYDMVKSAWDKVLEFFGIKSPSRLAAEAGRYIDEGFAVGLKEYADVVSDATVDVGKSAMDSLTDSLSGISDAVNDNLNTEPTIRPVLDLSNVKSGASALGNMLSMDSSVGVLANTGAISSMMSQRRQNGGTDDVVSAINKLGHTLENADHATYNINGVTYDDGSGLSRAVAEIIRIAQIDRRA
jgi:tape measure domain-containing protein